MANEEGVERMRKRLGLDGEVLTEQDIIKHKRLLRECGLPDTIGDSVSQEKLEERYPHLKMTEAEKEVRRIVNESEIKRRQSW